MKDKIASILDQAADPEQPWVWLPTDTEPELWELLVKAAHKAGFAVIDLDAESEITSQKELIQAFQDQAGAADWAGSSMNALKDTLAGLPKESKGWVIVLRNPDTLAEQDPETFEDLLDVVETANDARTKNPITLITLDADEDAAA